MTEFGDGDQNNFWSSVRCTDYCDITEECFEAPAALDMECQRQIVLEDRRREHIRWCVKHHEASLLPVSQRRIALKILISEACQRELQHNRRLGLGAQRDQQVMSYWSLIGNQISAEMKVRDNSATVLKHLSCMCIFVDGRQSREYGENNDERIRRTLAKEEVLARMRELDVLFLPPEETRGGSPELPISHSDTSVDELSAGPSDESLDDRKTMPVHSYFDPNEFDNCA